MLMAVSLAGHSFHLGLQVRVNPFRRAGEGVHLVDRVAKIVFHVRLHAFYATPAPPQVK